MEGTCGLSFSLLQKCGFGQLSAALAGEIRVARPQGVLAGWREEGGSEIARGVSWLGKPADAEYGGLRFKAECLIARASSQAASVRLRLGASPLHLRKEAGQPAVLWCSNHIRFGGITL